MRATIIHADVISALKSHEPNTFDAVLCDPPYGMSFMNQRWDYEVPDAALWRAVLRVLKPGAPLIAFSSTRTYHRAVVEIEDAGFEIRDCFAWLYAQGFPKNLDVAKAIDKQRRLKREVLGHRPGLAGGGFGQTGHGLRSTPDAVAVTAPASELARTWEGYGTALKPSYEPAVLARKPLDGTVAENVTRWGVGALAIDASRITRDEADAMSGWATTGSKAGDNRAMSGKNYERAPKEDADARWPANLMFDEAAGAMLDEQSGERKGGVKRGTLRESRGSLSMLPGTRFERDARGHLGGLKRDPRAVMGDTGGASRFFFCPKPSTEERELGCAHLPKRSAGEMTGGRQEGSDALDSPRTGAGRGGGARNHHPTIKPVDLMRYLARLIMPPKPGKLLVPFAGSGSEMIGARLAGWEDITGIEWKAEFVTIAEARVALAEKKPGLFEREIRASRNKNLRSLSERFTQQNVPRMLGRKA